MVWSRLRMVTSCRPEQSAVCSLQCSLCMWEMQQTDGRAALSPPATLNMWTVLGGRKSIFSLDQGWDTVWTTLQNISNISCQNNSKQAGSWECLKQQVDVVCIYGNKSGLDDPWMNRHFSRVVESQLPRLSQLKLNEHQAHNWRHSWPSSPVAGVLWDDLTRDLDWNLLSNHMIKWNENKHPHLTRKTTPWVKYSI